MIFKRENLSSALLENLDLAFTLLFTLLCIIFTFLEPLNETSARIFLGLSLTIFLPGYSLITALFPRRDNLDGIEWILLSLGLSFAITSLFGFGLNYTPFGIRLRPILALLSIFTIACSLVAWTRRIRLTSQDRVKVPFDFFLRVKSLYSGFLIDKVLSVILILSIIGSSATMIYVVVMPKTGERFTEFYLLDPSGTAFDYPTNLKIGEEGKVIIGIVNYEHENVTYRLEVNFNGSLIHEENAFLIENEKWESLFTFIAVSNGENQILEFLLYKDQQIEAYRKLHLRISVIDFIS